MRWQLIACVVVGWLAATSQAHAAADQAPLDLPVWSVIPFAALLLAIAILPLVAEHWWHKNRNKAIVSAAVAIPSCFTWHLFMSPRTSRRWSRWGMSFSSTSHLSFCWDRFSPCREASSCAAIWRPGRGQRRVSGGRSAARQPDRTTGASVLLIRPLLRINRPRQYTRHLPIFFVFTVSNVGGLLTPLGDPPLFLGFLNGVPFGWTLTLWKEWLFVNGLVLALFVLWTRWPTDVKRRKYADRKRENGNRCASKV